MDIFIYASPGFGGPRDRIEDAIEEFLGDRGEVAGGGAGTMGANIDIEVQNEESVGVIVEGLRRILIEFDVPRSTRIVAGIVEFPLHE